MFYNRRIGRSIRKTFTMSVKTKHVLFAVFFALIATVATPVAHASTPISGTIATLDSSATTQADGPVLGFIWMHTVGPAVPAMLIVGVVSHSILAVSVTTVTYGGTGLTKITSQTSGISIDSELWQLANPKVGTFPIVVTFSGPATTGAFAYSASFFGIAGLRCFAGAPALAAGILVPPFGCGTVGDLLVDAVGTELGTITPDPLQTQLANSGAIALGGLLTAGGSMKGAGSGFVMFWVPAPPAHGGESAIVMAELIPTAAIPEYPWGLPVLLVLMAVSYGVIRRRTAANGRT